MREAQRGCEVDSGARERLAREGVEALGDAELVALVLGTGPRGTPVAVLAAALLHEVGGLRPLGRHGVAHLAGRHGLGEAKAARLVAALEMGARVATRAEQDRSVALPNSEAVAAWGRARLGTLEHEELWALALDGRHRLRAARRVALGGLHGLSVAPRDVLRVTLREAASAFVLVHNHPSGDPSPSQEDLAFTCRLAVAADAIGVPLLDHVVVSRHGHVSLLDSGKLPSPVATSLSERRPAPHRKQRTAQPRKRGS